jgi:ABC-type transport system involved in Fe-S cluster assembly fused permease/ATPase subunit
MLGAGKSTIAKLVFRFFDTTGGKIYVDNIDITQMRQQDLREKIGIVPQDTGNKRTHFHIDNLVLFNDTIKYNIQYGNLKASEEEVIEAAKVARIMGLIERLPDGWNTKVGERGLRLSGGEKQRVSIARAVLKVIPPHK